MAEINGLQGKLDSGKFEVMGFWDPTFWLPRNVSWESIKSTDTLKYPEVHDFQNTIYIGAVLVILRVFMESLIFVPIGCIFGWIKEPMLTRMMSHLTGGFLGKSRFKKASESAWRCTFFVCAWLSGLWVLRNEPQFYDVTECWRNWPKHAISTPVYWYYMIEGGFYWALFFCTALVDVRRHDFLQMMLHHGVTLGLLFISWSMNMVRVGTLILFSHDAADIFIELAKLFRYAKWDGALTACFVILMIIWSLTRLVYFPLWILRSIIVDAPSFIQTDYSWWNLSQRPIVPRVLMIMLCTLLVLHIFWTSLLVKVAIQAQSKTGQIDDIREDDSDEDSDQDVKKKN